MDAELVALATTGATTVVSLAATDAWTQVKRGITQLFDRFRPDSHDVIEAALEEAGREISGGDVRPEIAKEILQEWTSRFRRLLLSDPGASAAFRELVTEWREISGDRGGPATSIFQTATASGSSRVYQQGSGTQINL